MADSIHTNIQVLKGLPENIFLQTMGFFSARRSAESCSFCHIPRREQRKAWARYADESPAQENMARYMVNHGADGINKQYFGGRRVVTCYSCHLRGGDTPRVTPSIAELYGPPQPEEPDVVLPATGGPTADQILTRYLQVLGGEQKVAAITSFTAKGTYQGYGAPDKNPVEIFAKAPAQRTLVVHIHGGDITTATDGRLGWIAAPQTDKPIPVIDLAGRSRWRNRGRGAAPSPARIKQSLTDWRVGYPVPIDDKDADVLQGLSATKSRVKLFFDKEESGPAWVRAVRYTDTAIGLGIRRRLITAGLPGCERGEDAVQDHGELAGRQIHYGTDRDQRPNVAIEAAKFARPAPLWPSEPTDSRDRTFASGLRFAILAGAATRTKLPGVRLEQCNS